MTGKKYEGLESSFNLQKSNCNEFEDIPDYMPMGILSCDREGNITSLNDFLLFILDSPSTEAAKQINVLTFQPFVESGISAKVEEAITSGQNTLLETSCKLKSGKELILSMKAFPRKKPNGETGGCHVIIFEEQFVTAPDVADDITALRRSVEALEKKERRYRTLIEQLSDAVIINTFEGQILEVNDRTCEMLGYSRDQLQKMTIYDLMPPGRRESARENMSHFIRKGSILAESKFITADGSVLNIEVNARALEGYNNTAQAVVRNITDRKRAEEKLRQSEALLNEMGKIAKIGGWEIDLGSGKHQGTAEIANIHEFDYDDMQGLKINDGLNYYTPKSKEIIEKAFNKLIEKAEPYDLELELITAKGNHKWVRTCAYPKLVDGKVVKVTGTMQDITEHKNAKNKLRDNEEKFRLLIEHSPVSLLMLDREMRHIAVSRHYLDTFSLEEEDLIGLNHYDVFPETFDEFNEVHRRAMEGEVIRNEEHRLKLADGGVQWNRWEVRPWTRSDGTIGGIIIFSEDITERKKAEEEILKSETRYRSLFEQSNDAIMVHDLEGKIVDVNKMACKILGYTEDEIKQKSVFDLIAPDDRERIVSKLRYIRIKGHLRTETRIMRSDGTVLILDVNSSLINTQEELILAVGRDITDRIEAEKAMLDAKIEAEIANRTKSDFLANMSHELRTPLNSIIGFSDAMIDGISGNLEPRQEHYLHHISNSGHHLLTLINDILDLSKIEAGKMDLHLEIIDVGKVVDEIVTMTETLSSEKKINIEVDMPEQIPGIQADRSKFKQILYNLVGNAIKFTDSGGKITVRAETDDRTIRVSVIDTGIGISLNDQEKLFKPFSQIDSSSSRIYQGTGLGLALVKELVESHGGRIWVESEFGKGSKFIFEIPIDQSGRAGNY